MYTKYNAQPLVPDLGAELNTVLLGKLGTFTGADEGEGLDLNGDIRYAINVGGPETVVGSVTFTDGSKDGMENGSSPGASVNAINEIPGWISPAYGDSEADLALASVVQSIRYGAEYKVDLDVNHGETYQLQLMFAESCCDRGFDISIDGTLAVDNFSIPTLQEGVNNATKGVVYTATITAQSDLLSIVLNGKNPRVADNLPILNAITLEKLTSIPGDYDHNGVLDATDLDLQAQGMLDNNAAVYDLTGDSAVDFKDREFWISTLKHTYVGDANLDGQFDSEDFVQVFIAGKYETGETATWTEGDWSGDKTFNSEDFVVAFIGGGYEVGPRGAVAAVPEPASALLWLSGAMVTWCCHRKRTVRR